MAKINWTFMAAKETACKLDGKLMEN